MGGILRASDPKQGGGLLPLSAKLRGVILESIVSRMTV